ncbi:MAG: siderophore-interacting protein [Nocardioides sp.]
MTTRARHFEATVVGREALSPHLVRLTLAGPALAAGFASSGIPDEWVGLVVPGQFQSRYYTVRRFAGGELTLDVVLHDVGLVTEWASRDCTGETVQISEPRGSFAPPADAEWVYLVGDLTGLPAMARIAEEWGPAHPGIRLQFWAESADDLPHYLPESDAVTWSTPPAEAASGLAGLVESLTWPPGRGYFWMAGESAQMRAIRRHLMSAQPGLAHDVMGYWRAVLRRQPRAVDPAPIWRAGKAAGRTDQQIWAAYDAARDQAERPEG